MLYGPGLLLYGTLFERRKPGVELGEESSGGRER